MRQAIPGSKMPPGFATIHVGNDKLRAAQSRMREINARQEEIENHLRNTNGGKFTAESRSEYEELDREYRSLHDSIQQPKNIDRIAMRRSLVNDGARKMYQQDDGRDPLFAKRFGVMFALDELDSAGFKSDKEYFKAIASGRSDDRLMALSQGEYSDPLGGFAVPTQFASDLMDSSLENEIVRPLARVVPMESETLELPRWDGYDRSTGTLFGGLSAEWTAETLSVTPSSAKLEQMKLSAKNLMLYLKVTNQLLEDAGTFGADLKDAISGTVSFQLDDAFLNGNGVGKPLGMLNDPALIVIPKESNQPADTVCYENLTKMFARMYSAGRSRAVWVVNDTLIPSLLGLTIQIGTGGDHVPVMTRGPDGFEILTRPVVFTEKVPAAGDQGDISFVDFSQYSVGMRIGMRIDYSPHESFASNQTAFRAIVRADGIGNWREPIQPKSGETQSWCVTLAERA